MFKYFLRSKKPLSYSLAGETWKWSRALVLLFTSGGAKDIHLSRQCVGCWSSLEPLTLNTPLGTEDATPMRVRLPDGTSPLREGFHPSFHCKKGLSLQLKSRHGKVALIFSQQEMQPRCYMYQKLGKIISFWTLTNESNRWYFNTIKITRLLPNHYWEWIWKGRYLNGADMASTFPGLHFLLHFPLWSML